MIERIIITGDTNRPINQFGNISFFYNILKFQIGHLTDIDLVCHASTDRHLDFDEWIERESNLNWPEDEYSKSHLVIGFEMSQALEQSLEKRDIPFISFDISPIRFMTDLCVRIRNHSRHFCFPFSWELSEKEIQFEANYMKASKFFAKGSHFTDRSVLVVGQTRNDRSVIHDGKYQWIGDYCELMKEVLDGYDIYYKAHPYNDDALIVCEMLNAHNVSEFNVYRLLATDELDCVVGLSSSVLHEAKYFGKRAHAMLPLSKAVTTLSARKFLSVGFWRDVLGQIISCNDEAYEIDYRQGMLRIGLGSYWSYDLFYKQDF